MLRLLFYITEAMIPSCRVGRTVVQHLSALMTSDAVWDDGFSQDETMSWKGGAPELL